MKKIACQFSACMFLLLVNITPLRAGLQNSTFPVPGLDFQYAELKVPDFILISEAAGPWLKIIKTQEALQALYTQAWIARNSYPNVPPFPSAIPSPIPPQPALPEIDFEHYQLVMGGLGSKCYWGTGGGYKLGIFDISSHDLRHVNEESYISITIYHNKFLDRSACFLEGIHHAAIAILMVKTDLPIKIRSFEASFKNE